MSGVDPDALVAIGRLIGSERSDGAEFVQQLLRSLRTHLSLEVAFVAEFTGGRRTFRVVDSDLATPVKVGGSDPLDATFCVRVVDGRLPEVIGDARRYAEASTLSLTDDLQIRAYLSVPIRLTDGSVYGTLCVFSTTPDLTVSEGDTAVLHIAAGAIATEIESAPDRWVTPS